MPCLCCDLHVLFDDFLITINPDNWSIQGAPELMKFPDLAALDGRPVQIREDLRPQFKYIQDHSKAAYAEWNRRSAAIGSSRRESAAQA